MRMNRQPNILGVGAHFDGKRTFSNQIAGVRADNGSTNDPLAARLK